MPDTALTPKTDSSSHRKPTPSDGQMMSANSVSTGPIQLPSEMPDAFIEAFNRTYARIGLTVRHRARIDNR